MYNTKFELENTKYKLQTTNIGEGIHLSQLQFFGIKSNLGST